MMGDVSDVSIVRSLAIQSRILHALMMREVITRFGRDNLGVLWLFVEPMLFTLGVSAIWTAAGMNHGSSIPIAAFALTGYSSVLLWRNCANRCVMAIDSNLPLLFHRNVKVIDVFLTRIVLEIAGATASFAILGIYFTSIEWMDVPVDLMQVIFGWFMLTWFGAAVALVIGAGTAYSEVVEKLWGPAAYLLFPLSGAAYMVEWLPPALQKFVLLLPMVHGVEILREGYFGNVVKTHYDLSYMSICCLVLTLVGLYLVRDAGQKVEAR
jgi:ABC-type polysaccharide/polyol phosphate export permease